MPDTPDPLAAELAAIAARGYQNGARGALCARLSDAAAEDVPRLVAAVEAALKLAATWNPFNGGTAAMATEIRSAVTRHLLGEDGTPMCQPSLTGEAAASAQSGSGFGTLLGQRVRVIVDENVVREGKLLGFGDDGEFQLLGDDGEVWHGWPALVISALTGEGDPDAH